jgi:hypothetical protein
VHVLGAERVGGDHGDEGRVDTARQPEHDVREPVLGDVVPRGEDEGVVDLADVVEERLDRRGSAGLGVIGDRARHGGERQRHGRVAAARVEQAGAEDGPDVEVDDRGALAELGQARHDVAVVVDDERGAVEDQLVLPADLVHVGDVAVRVLGARRDHALALDLSALEVRRAVRDGDELGTSRGLGRDGSVGTPHVLAHRDPDLDARDLEQLQRVVAGGEVPLLVEDRVVGQEALVVRPHDLSHGADRGGVVQVPSRVHEADHRGAPPGVGGDLRERFPVRGDEAGLEDEILRRVAGDGQLREDGEIAAGRLGLVIGREDAGDVAVEVTDHGVELAQPQADARHHLSVGVAGHGPGGEDCPLWR